MKKIILAVFCFMLMSFCSKAQSLTDNSMTFYGVDFSLAKMVGESGFPDSKDLKVKFSAWNALFKSEPDKYDLKKAFKKEKVYLEFNTVNSHNDAVSISDLVTNNDYNITSTQVETLVKNFDTQGKSGLACLFVVSSFDKNKVTGTIYVVLFDAVTKKILVNKKMEEKPGGFGLRNYWAKAICNTIEDCQSLYKKWLKGKDL